MAHPSSNANHPTDFGSRVCGTGLFPTLDVSLPTAVHLLTPPLVSRYGAGHHLLAVSRETLATNIKVRPPLVLKHPFSLDSL